MEHGAQSRGVSISRDEWLKALAAAGIDDETHDPDAVTVAEFAEMFGVNRQTAMRRLQALEKAGAATRTRKRQTDVSGRSISFIAFRLNAPAKATRR